MTAPLFPLFADLRGREVLVVGGGVVARRKVVALMEAGACVVVGAPVLDPSLARWALQGRIRHLAGDFNDSWVDSAWLAIAATDDAATNRAVAAAGLARRVWVNAVDDAASSSFQVPARVDRGPLQIAISSGGGAPMVARHVRELLETQIDASFGALTALLTRQRQRIRARLPDLQARRRFFDRVLVGPAQALLRRGADAQAEREVMRALSDTPGASQPGRVALVGAGPGDPGLLTLRALRLLNEADVILHDRLVSPQVLAMARRDAELVDVGKHVGGDQASTMHTSQDRIHALLVQHARAGRVVVRLKGGDPFVFGRGGEELEALRDAGIAYEVVPGITAALACAAYAGIPLTHRDHAQSVRLLTAHCQASAGPLDWKALAHGRQTLAVYMGVSGLKELRDRLIDAGKPRGTPFALVENGSRPGQRVVLGTLADLAETACHHRVQSPALLIIGEVAALAGTLHWYGSAPLGRIPLAECAQAA